MPSLKGKTLIITGASRGIGRAIALRCAKEGANLVIAAKTTEEDFKRKGTIFDVAREVESLGGKALSVKVDVREESQIITLVEKTVERFGGIDAVVNNAGAIRLSAVEGVPLRSFDLMLAVNIRALFLAVQTALPYLKKSPNSHILNICPPIDLSPKWFRGMTPYTVSKYGMSMLTLGLAAELSDYKISVNGLWPKTTIATAAIDMLGGEAMRNKSRTPEIMADAAHAILATPFSQRTTGRFLLDERILRSKGIRDFKKYAVKRGEKLLPDLYVTF